MFYFPPFNCCKCKCSCGLCTVSPLSLPPLCIRHGKYAESNKPIYPCINRLTITIFLEPERGFCHRDDFKVALNRTIYFIYLVEIKTGIRLREIRFIEVHFRNYLWFKFGIFFRWMRCFIHNGIADLENRGLLNGLLMLRECFQHKCYFICRRTRFSGASTPSRGEQCPWLAYKYLISSKQRLHHSDLSFTLTASKPLYKILMNLAC